MLTPEGIFTFEKERPTSITAHISLQRQVSTLARLTFCENLLIGQEMGVCFQD